MNWPILILFGIGVIALVIFMIRRNMKDEKEFENQLDRDYNKPKDAGGGEVKSDEIIK